MSGRGAVVVGAGRRGRQWVEAIRSHRGWTLVGVVDPDERARAGLPGWASIAEIPDRAAASVAAAVVASPAADHGASAVACLRRGWHVLVEKPVAIDRDEVEAISSAAAAAGRRALAAHNLRFHPREEAIRRALPDLGPWLAAHVTVVRPPIAGQDAAAMIGDIAVHHLDAALTRYGERPVAVRASGAADGVEIAVRFAGGQLWTYRHVAAGAAFHHGEWIGCAEGGLAVRDARVELVSPRHRPRRLRAPCRWDAESRLLDALAAPGNEQVSEVGACAALVATLSAAVRALHSRNESCVEVVGTEGRR